MTTQRSQSSKSTKESAPTSQHLSSVAHEAIDRASDKAETVEKKLRAEASKLAEKSSDRANEAKKQFDVTIDRLDHFIREKPFTAAGIAFAAGALGAMLIKR